MDQVQKKEKIVLRKEVFMILFEVLCWHLSGENEGNCNKTLSRFSSLRFGFEPGASQI